MRKTILGLGAGLATLAPIATAIACSTSVADVTFNGDDWKITGGDLEAKLTFKKSVSAIDSATGKFKTTISHSDAVVKTVVDKIAADVATSASGQNDKIHDLVKLGLVWDGKTIEVDLTTGPGLDLVTAIVAYRESSINEGDDLAALADTIGHELVDVYESVTFSDTTATSVIEAIEAIDLLSHTETYDAINQVNIEGSSGDISASLILLGIDGSSVAPLIETAMGDFVISSVVLETYNASASGTTAATVQFNISHPNTPSVVVAAESSIATVASKVSAITLSSTAANFDALNQIAITTDTDLSASLIELLISNNAAKVTEITNALDPYTFASISLTTFNATATGTTEAIIEIAFGHPTVDGSWVASINITIAS